MARKKAAVEGEAAEPRYITAEDFIPRLWVRYKVGITFTHHIRGGTPKHPDVIEGWIRSRFGDTSVAEELATQAKSAMGVDQLSEEDKKKLKELVWCGFKKNAEGYLVHEGRALKAMLKECANIVRDKLGITALKARVAERMFVLEDSVSLGVKEPTGAEQGFVHAMTPSGPIDALKMTDFVEGATLRFTVLCLDNPYVTSDKQHLIEPGELLKIILHYGTMIGTGAERGQSHGRFVITEFERLP